MPNWCEGNLRLRGTGTAILEFLKNELECVGYDGGGLLAGMKNCPVKVGDEYDEIDVGVPEEAAGWRFLKMYIKGTRRNFVNDKQFDFYIGGKDEREEVRVLCIDNVSAAWGFEPEPYVEKAKQYGLDIKIIGFEKGMQFAQIIEIVGGELIKDQEVKFDDWDWECVMPNMGG